MSPRGFDDDLLKKGLQHTAPQGGDARALPWGEGNPRAGGCLRRGSLIGRRVMDRPVSALQDEVAVRDHDQRDVPVQSWPEAALVVVEPKFALGVLIEALHRPAHVDQCHEFGQMHAVEAPGEVVLQLAPMLRAGALADKHAATGQVLAPASAAEDGDGYELPGERPFVPLAPGHAELLSRRARAESTTFPRESP